MQAYDSGCMCEVNTCYTGAPAYDSPEGKEMRLRGARHLRLLCLLQLMVSPVVLLAGIVSLGVGLKNPSYPKVNGYGIVTGTMMLVGALYGRKASTDQAAADCDQKTKNYIMVHYIMDVLDLTFATLMVISCGIAMGNCFSDDADTFSKCMPFETVNIIMDVVQVILGLVLCVSSILGSVFFCVYARPFGFTNQYQNLHQEVATLRQEVNEYRSREQNYHNDYFSKNYSSFDQKKSLDV